MDGINLIVISPLRGVLRHNGKILLTRKFFDGMALYREFWKGPIIHVCEPGDQASDNLDNMEVDLEAGPFRTACMELTDDNLAPLLKSPSLVLASVGEQFNRISRLCQNAGVPCVYITEYSLQTRLQIVKEYQPDVVRGAWRSMREIWQERAQVRALRIANGVQCNGTPTYLAYKPLTPLPHLFFDTRIEETMLARPSDVSGRLARLEDDRILRLVFSGRLKLMKGVDDLPLVADHLRRLAVPFQMFICGEGEYLDQLRRDVATLNLGGHVDFRGTLDFKTELVPFVKSETDLFICCHRQGDPSCTYLETMACGVPIVGYNNEALQGVVQASRTGWTVPLGKSKDLAERIASIYRDLSALRTAAQRSLEFARDHTFEKTFRRRIEHLDLVFRRAAVASAA